MRAAPGGVCRRSPGTAKSESAADMEQSRPRLAAHSRAKPWPLPLQPVLLKLFKDPLQWGPERRGRSGADGANVPLGTC